MFQDWEVICTEAGFTVGVVSSYATAHAPYIEVVDDDWTIALRLAPRGDSGALAPSFSAKIGEFERRISYGHELNLECVPGDVTITDDGLLSAITAPSWTRGMPADPFDFRTGFTVQLPAAAVPAVRFAIAEAFKRASIAAGVATALEAIAAGGQNAP